ncbi:MAG: DNA mismatch repair protein MutS [Dehalococcoidia bacterium]|nr:DNA mismatch repair protein MutS [Dehalococcoidia bacterium]MCB9506574.1 DNA mismatch repair protein MutS [Myxococcales bacterium]
MMRQFLQAKEEHPDCIVLFRMGDFYEVFFEDAVVVSQALDLTLTARGKEQGEPIPMAGVPHHAAEGYIRRLVEQGHHVAICEQLEDPAQAKGIVRRGVTRVITPGVVLDSASLDARANNFLAALAVSTTKAGDIVALAYVDVSTGELRVTELAGQTELIAELRRVAPAEALVAEAHLAVLEPLVRRADRTVTRRPDRALSLTRTVAAAEASTLAVAQLGQSAATLSPAELRERLAALDAATLRDRDAVDAALSLLIDYLLSTQGGVPLTLAPPVVVRSTDYMVLDPASSANLEIFETLMGGNRAGSLLRVIDQSVTPAGGRRLRTWLSYPLLDVTAIRARQAAVSVLVGRLELRSRVRDALKACGDIQRLCARIAAGQGNARDVAALGVTLAAVPGVAELLGDVDDPTLTALAASLDPCEELCGHIAAALVDEPPTALNEGGLIRGGYSPELDTLIEATTDSQSWLLEFERAEQHASGISSLKVRYNRVFGYYIEITNANRDLVPSHYIRKQTLANAERYYTAELKEREELILTAKDRRAQLEYELFERLRADVVAHVVRLRLTAERLAELDALAGLAELSHRRGYSAPEVVAERGVWIRDGRHPVVEAVMEGGRFVPNDTRLGDEERLLLITGPNMAGKSTVIRQVALIVLLAQIGSHVPASEARIGVVDQIFSRVGASDNLAKGQSTFMVEMTETAHILTHATGRSLVILDEIGRGTSTYDGLSIAWAVAEHLHDEIGALTLFATHYHELTGLARTKPALRNYNIAVKEWQHDIIFLHKLLEGPANRSYGIQVARLAGVPEAVVGRAREVLSNLERQDYDSDSDSSPIGRSENAGPVVSKRSAQLALFGGHEAPPQPAVPAVVNELAQAPLDTLAPIQALNLLYTLQKRARKLVDRG